MDKSKLWARIRAFFRYVVLPALFAITVVASTLNYLMIETVSAKADDTYSLLEDYSEIDALSGAFSEQDLASFERRVVHSPSGDDAISWMLLESLTVVLHGGYGKESEQITRKALNRLQGLELQRYIMLLEDKVKDFRNPGFKDMLELEGAEDYPEKVRAAMIQKQDAYIFADKELEALKACSDYFNEMREGFLPLIGEYEWTLYYTFPELIRDRCSLTGKIAI